jgi:hypothetical protein
MFLKIYNSKLSQRFGTLKLDDVNKDMVVRSKDKVFSAITRATTSFGFCSTCKVKEAVPSNFTLDEFDNLILKCQFC